MQRRELLTSAACGAALVAVPRLALAETSERLAFSLRIDGNPASGWLARKGKDWSFGVVEVDGAIYPTFEVSQVDHMPWVPMLPGRWHALEWRFGNGMLEGWLDRSLFAALPCGALDADLETRARRGVELVNRSL